VDLLVCEWASRLGGLHGRIAALRMEIDRSARSWALSGRLVSPDLG